MSSLIGFPICPSKQASEKSAISRHTEIKRACSDDPSQKMEDYDKYFNSKWKVWQNLYESSNIEIWSVKSQINKNKLSLAKIFKRINNKKQLRYLMQQYITITNNCLLLYEGIYYSKKQSLAVIVMERLHHSLPSINRVSMDMHKTFYQKRENYVKQIVSDVLDKLWILHNNNYVHSQIIPSHIMLRDCNKVDANKLHMVIKNGWKLIGFNHIATNQQKLTKMIPNKMIGWSAPELDIRKKANKVTFAADIWSFGLVILKLLIGYQPFELNDATQKQLFFDLANDKSNKRNKIRKEWYVNKLCNNVRGQLYVTRFLQTLHANQIMSMELFTLLCAGMLRFNPQSRWNCKQICNCMWLNNCDWSVSTKHKPKSKQIIVSENRDDLKNNENI